MTSRCCAVCALALALMASPADGQLRPIDAIPWHLLDGRDAIHVAIGGELLSDQPASLAGTRGTLYDLVDVLVAWKTGRVLLQVSGPLIRRFEDGEQLEAPEPGVDAPDGEIRRDAGDILAETTVHVLGGGDAAVALRFGARLPTTSVAPGLERDRTDFFASAGGRHRVGRVLVAGEAGIGILGTRDRAAPEQSDVLTWAAGIELDAGAVAPHATVVGQDDLRRRRIRGDEDLAELRVGVRVGGRLWLDAMAIRGIADYSPRLGIMLIAGVRL